jgi:PIN domain nuclease of toxin-antitoxin system
VRVLIDTHYVLWAALDSTRMEAWAKKLIADLPIPSSTSSAFDA